MCVVVKGGKIVFISLNRSTTPDYPFDPTKNRGDPMPTIKSGIYSFKSVKHRGQYDGLNVQSTAVVRHRSISSYYTSTSQAINVHRRSSNSIAPWPATWVNSVGCLLVGNCPDTSSFSSEYARFLQSLDIINSNETASSKGRYSVSGYIIVDRSYAASYLRAIGYSSRAIQALG